MIVKKISETDVMEKQTSVKLDYNITLEKEVIREMSANCLAAIFRSTGNADNKFLIIAEDRISDIYSEVIGSKEYDTIESLYKARGEIELVRLVLKKMSGE